MVYYFNPEDKRALAQFSETLEQMILKHEEKYDELVLVCIGSDRATGDALGPIVGHRLSNVSRRRIAIYGTLEKPVHASNLASISERIQKYHENALVIAIDASLGIMEHVGYITLGEGSLSPGIGVNKDLPQIGDLFITGIVNIAGFGGQMLLQTTRLNIVMKLADFIATGIYCCLRPAKSRHLSKSRTSLQSTKQRNLVDAL